MRSLITKGKLIFYPQGKLRSLSTQTQQQNPQKLTRIADDLLSLNAIELHDYTTLFRHKLGLNNTSAASLSLSSSATPGGGDPKAEVKKEEKTTFDVKLEKFDAASKIKIIKEVRSFTDLGLKEAKDLVEKTPVVVKMGVAKDEAEGILEKLKAIGATVVLE